MMLAEGPLNRGRLLLLWLLSRGGNAVGVAGALCVEASRTVHRGRGLSMDLELLVVPCHLRFFVVAHDHSQEEK